MIPNDRTVSEGGERRRFHFSKEVSLGHVLQ